MHSFCRPSKSFPLLSPLDSEPHSRREHFSSDKFALDQLQSKSLVKSGFKDSFNHTEIIITLMTMLQPGETVKGSKWKRKSTFFRFSKIFEIILLPNSVVCKICPQSEPRGKHSIPQTNRGEKRLIYI